jgi:hypothetical protein
MMRTNNTATVAAAALFTTAFMYQISPAQTPSQLSWSENPGAFEQHLQRRYRNPLFPPNRRIVTQADINSARLRDHEDYAKVNAQMNRLTDDLLKLPDDVSSSQIDAFRERMDDLIQAALGVGGPAYEIASRVKRLRQTAMQSWRVALAGNEEALRALDQAEQFWHANSPTFEIPFIAQMLRKSGSIPANDILPALLSEQPEIIASFMNSIKDPQKKAIIQSESVSILKSAVASGVTIKELDLKMQALGLTAK